MHPGPFKQLDKEWEGIVPNGKLNWLPEYAGILWTDTQNKYLLHSLESLEKQTTFDLAFLTTELK